MEKEKKGKKKAIIIVAILLILVICITLYVMFNKDLFAKKEQKTNKTKVEQKLSPYSLKSNNLELFDLRFLQLENEQSNKIYSPLSIKTALGMLNEGTEGQTKEQIANIIGTYKMKKYVNSQNMSFANALFVRDSYKKNINENYLTNLNNNYNAEVIYDSFANANNLNNWVKDKTFNLIDSVFDDVSDLDFVLTNALAIDMEWVNKIQSEHDDYEVSPKHEDYNYSILSLDGTGYNTLKFNNNLDVKSAQIGAVANRYDIVSTLGESNIREEVGKAYSEYLAKDECGTAAKEPDVNTYLNTYINELNSNYKQVSSSTDFYFYDDENIKAFAKDLKEYNGITLEYIGIMPKSETLSDYISNTDDTKINKIINDLKPIELNSFKDGVITEIDGYIPMFKFDYELNLIDDLKSLGITDVFDSSKADLSKLTSSKGAYIEKAAHKANIEFSNDGIKAGAVTALGGKGAADCGFRFDYEVPVEKINITFDKPYLFFVRDKESGEVWFTGTVYQPISWSDQMNYNF